MNLNKCISKFLSKSLLVSMGISCFGCSVSYMMETNGMIGGIPGIILIDKETLENIFGSINMLTQNHIENKFIGQKRSHEPSNNFFDNEISKRLSKKLSVNSKSPYLEDLKKLKKSKEENKPKYAQTKTKISMLLTTQLIRALDLDSKCLELYYPDDYISLCKIKDIKSAVMESGKVADDQLSDFVDNFFKIVNKINTTRPKESNNIKEIKKSFDLDDSKKRAHLKDSLLAMFKTLDYCEKNNASKPSRLFTDYIPKNSENEA